MKAALGLLVLPLTISVASAPLSALKPIVRPATTGALALALKLPQKVYSPLDEIEANVTLTNRSKQTFFVRRFVGWGEGSSVSVWIYDLSGKSMTSDFWPDELDPPVTSLVELEELKPGASKRFTVDISLGNYNLKRGTSYSIKVVYHSSIAPNTDLRVPVLTVGHPRISSSGTFAVR
jgi:hypothetical protein